jgi:hypothetical protein
LSGFHKTKNSRISYLVIASFGRKRSTETNFFNEDPNFAFEPHANQFYAYLFWMNHAQQSLGKAVPRDTFYLSGWGKQACFVIPSLDMVVVRLGSHAKLNEHPEFYREFLFRLMATVSDRK